MLLVVRIYEDGPQGRGYNAQIWCGVTSLPAGRNRCGLTVNAHQRVVTVFTTQTGSRGQTAFFTAGSFYDWVS